MRAQGELRAAMVAKEIGKGGSVYKVVATEVI